MADALSVISRPVAVEDFIDPANVNTVFQQLPYNVLGIGSALITPLVVAANDAAAAAAGVPQYGIYICNGGAFNYLRSNQV
jgi:hypothetical protein